MKIATITYNPTRLIEGCLALGEGRDIKPANLENAIDNILANGINYHTVKGYRSGGIKDGWHHLNACNILIQRGQLPVGTVLNVEIHG